MEVTAAALSERVGPSSHPLAEFMFDRLLLMKVASAMGILRDGLYLLLPPLTQYVSPVILMNMKVGERGQVTIPKEIREQFGLGPDTEVEFHVVGGSIVLRKAPKKLNLDKWKGRCAPSLSKLGYSSVDEFIDDVRGR